MGLDNLDEPKMVSNGPSVPKWAQVSLSGPRVSKSA